MAARGYDTIVIGGGIIGCSAVPRADGRTIRFATVAAGAS